MSVRSAAVSIDDEADERLRYVVGANIKLARKLAGMSQEGLLDAVDRVFVRQQLSGWENGRRLPRNAVLLRIGAATGQSLGWFYESHDDDGG